MDIDMEKYVEYVKDVQWHFMELMLTAATQKHEDDIEDEHYDDASKLLLKGFIDNIPPDTLALDIIRALGLIPKSGELQ